MPYFDKRGAAATMTPPFSSSMMELPDGTDRFYRAIGSGMWVIYSVWRYSVIVISWCGFLLFIIVSAPTGGAWKI